MRFPFRQKKFSWFYILPAILLISSGLRAASVPLTWNANTEADLKGYKIYFGLQSHEYDYSQDAGNVLEYTVEGLTAGETYYFCMTAYDQNGNESGYSEEIAILVEDNDPPVVSAVVCTLNDMIILTYNEIVEKVSAEYAANYEIDNGIIVNRAERQADRRTVHLFTTQHPNGDYNLTVSNVRDSAAVFNVIVPATVQYSYSGNDETPPRVTGVNLLSAEYLQIIFNEPMDRTTVENPANYTFYPQIQIESISLDNSFSELLLRTSAHSLSEEYTLTIQNVKDGYAQPNTIVRWDTTYSWKSSDNVAPSLVAARAVNATTVTVEFSEEVSAATAVNTSNYSITQNGNTVAVSGAVLDGTARIVTLTTTALGSGDFTVSVQGVGDDAAPTNIMTSSSLAFTYTPPDYTAPSVAGYEFTGPNLLKVTFSEPVTAVSAEAISHYSITPSVAIQDVTLSADGRVLLIQTAAHPTNNYQLSISQVLDAAGNTIASNTLINYSYTVPDVTPPVLLSVAMHGADLVELIFSESLDRSSAEIIGNYSITPSLNVHTASLVGDQQDRVYLTTGAHNTGIDYTVAVSQLLDRAANPNVIDAQTSRQYRYTVEDHTAPELSSVELIGTAFIKVTFNEPVDETSAKTAANYQFTPSVQIQEISIDASLQTVFIRTGDHQPGTTYSLTVSNIKDRSASENVIGAGNVMPYLCQSVDNTPPAMVRADILSVETVEIVFTEPVDAASAITLGNYSINNGIVVQQVTISQSRTSVFLTTSAHARDSYTVTVSGVKDASAAGNVMSANSQASYQFIPADHIAPFLVSASFVSPTMVELLFNEPLNRLSAENKENYSINKSVVVERAMLTDDGMRVLLQTSTHLPGSYRVTINQVSDGSAAGNLIAGNTQGDYSYETVDNTPPEITTVTLNSGNRLVIAFTEAIDAATANDISHYQVNNGIVVKSAILTSYLDQVILETSDHAAGEFKLTVNGITDAATAKNPIAAYSQVSYAWNPPDIEKPRLAGVTPFGATSLQVSFNEAVNQIQAQNKDNYTITPDVPVLNAVLSADLNVVWLTTAPHNAGNHTLTVVNVQDRAMNPNTIGTDNQATYSYDPPDTEAPEISSAGMSVSPYVVTLVFNEALSSAEATQVSNYEITPNIDITEANLTWDQKTVKLETSQHQPNVTYTVTVRNLKDRAPIPNALEAPIQQQYMYTPPDKDAPQLVSVKVMGTYELELAFDEPLDKASAESRSNYHIEYGVDVNSAVLDESMQRVTLETSAHVPAMTYIMLVQNIMDRAPLPNKISPAQKKEYTMSVSGGSADQVPPVVTRIELLSTSAIDVVFNKPITKASAENKANYSVNGLTIKSAVLDTQLVRVHLETSSHQEGVDYTLSVRNITDRSSSPNTMPSNNVVNYLMRQGLAVSSLSRSNYALRGFSTENACYVDRDYIFSQVPTVLDGSIQIVTANSQSDKAATADNFLSFELSQEATVYIAYDQRQAQRPDWLNDWRVTGEQIVNNHSVVYTVLSKTCAMGRVVLGGNHATEDDNMYLAFIKPQAGSRSFVASMNKAAYRVERLAVGDAYYIDREYTVAQLPKQLRDMLWLQTANDDKVDQSENFLRFQLDGAATVYVAYDAGIANVPTWLDDFDKTILQIVDSRGMAFDVYARDYKKGEVVLGGNEGSSDDNMYMLLIDPDASAVDNDPSAAPGQFDVFQNYPNPFNPTTTISFMVQKPGHVRLRIYNVIGQLVRELVDEEMEAGVTHHVVWEGTDRKGINVASGMYFYRLEQGQFAKTNRMILVR